LYSHGLPVPKAKLKKGSDKYSSSILPNSKKISKIRLSPQREPEKQHIQAHQKKVRRTWAPEEDAELLELVKKYGSEWTKIASFMKSRNGMQVRDHYLNALAPDIKRDTWTEEEDQAILLYYNKFGPHWGKIAECVEGRTKTQVKGRFHTNLKQKMA